MNMTLRGRHPLDRPVKSDRCGYSTLQSRTMTAVVALAPQVKVILRCQHCLANGDTHPPKLFEAVFRDGRLEDVSRFVTSRHGKREIERDIRKSGYQRGLGSFSRGGSESLSEEPYTNECAECRHRVSAVESDFLDAVRARGTALVRRGEATAYI
jgi:hypothetical protein